MHQSTRGGRGGDGAKVIFLTIAWKVSDGAMAAKKESEEATEVEASAEVDGCKIPNEASSRHGPPEPRSGRLHANNAI